MNIIIETSRLYLRTWHTEDLPALIRLNQNEEVMRFFPKVLAPPQSKALFDRLQAHQHQHGFTYFAASLRATGTFIGFIGLAWQTYAADFTPCVDIGWRLDPQFWGQGLASEGAAACLAWAEKQADLPKPIVAVASAKNIASIRVMEKIGMQFCKTFSHSMLLDTSLNPCVLYRWPSALD